MRNWLPAGLVATALALPGAAFGQSMLGNAPAAPSAPTPDQNTVAVPPAPPIVAAPLSAPVQAVPMPQVMTPQPTPPGLVQTPMPPANMDNGQAGNDGTAPADNGAASPAPAPPIATTTAPGAPAAPAAVPDTASSIPPPPANTWVPEHTARIGLLDKVDGGASTVEIPVGGQTDAGDLQISVLACVTRPPGVIPDDAIFVSIQPVATGATGTASGGAPPGAAPAGAQPAAAQPLGPTQADAPAGGPAPPGADNLTPTGAADGGPIFRGWMIRSIPGATVVGDASETLRVVNCS